MSIFTLIILLPSAGYLGLIAWAIYLWLSTPDDEIVEPEVFPSITVLIPFRNEEKNLSALFQSLKRLQYPIDDYEIILINDHSDDRSLQHIERIRNLRIMHMRQGEAGKKMALEKGIAGARYDVIVTTDADCVLPEDWLLSIASVHGNSDVKFTTGPVAFTGDSAFANVQALENVGMMLLTHAGYKSGFFHLANGANLSVKWELFHQVQGYAGNRNRASGDDVLLAQKLSGKYEMHFRKSRSAIVETAAVKTLIEFWQQRVRWAAKTDLYTEFSLKLVQAFVAGFYLLILAMIIMIPMGYLSYAIWLVIVKLLADLGLFLAARRFFSFGWEKILYVPFASAFHLIYLPIVGVYSLVVKRYQWKERKVR